MHGPIDYIIVGFEGNKFDGSILEAVGDAIDSGVIGLIALSIISKDSDGVVSELDISELGDEQITSFVQSYPSDSDAVEKEDIDEVGDLLDPESTAGFLVVEQLWAKPLKEAILAADGFLIAEGRIHPDADTEINDEGAKQ